MFVCVCVCDFIRFVSSHSLVSRQVLHLQHFVQSKLHLNFIVDILKKLSSKPGEDCSEMKESLNVSIIDWGFAIDVFHLPKGLVESGRPTSSVCGRHRTRYRLLLVWCLMQYPNLDYYRAV